MKNDSPVSLGVATDKLTPLPEDGTMHRNDPIPSFIQGLLVPVVDNVVLNVRAGALEGGPV